MSRRLLAFVLALVVAGAPEALEACQVVCVTASHVEMSTPVGHVTHNHSHRHETAAGDRSTLQPVPYACDHVDALPSAARQSARVTVQPAIGATLEAFSIVRQSTRPNVPNLPQKPPGVGLLALPLRV